MPKTSKTINISFTFLIIAFALYWFAFRPLIAKAVTTTKEVEIKEANLELIKAKVANLANLKQDLYNAQVAEKASTQNIPMQLTLTELYSGIDSLTKASGLKVKQISAYQTFQPFTKDRRLKYIAVNLEGNTYFPQIIRFLDQLAKSNFLMQVENIELSRISKGNRPRLHFKVTLNAFEYSSDLQ